MRDLTPVGPYADVIEAPSPFDPNNKVKLGVRTDTFKRHVGRQLATAIAQYYGLVQSGLHHARHAFRGLKRPLMLQDDATADESVVVYTWRSQVDYIWSGSAHSGQSENVAAPTGRVFVVLIRDEEPKDFGVAGSIEHWNWVREDRTLAHAPVDWESRYEKKLWSLGV